MLTSEGTIVGTMPYMSPEQIEGKALDHRTDLFSLGVMFHEMLTGSRPFTGDSSPMLMSSILRDTPSSASPICGSEVPEPLGRLILRCLEKRPDDRVQTARDIYNELKHVQKQLESGPRRRPDSGAARTAGRRIDVDRHPAVRHARHRSGGRHARGWTHRRHHHRDGALPEPVGGRAAVREQLQGFGARHPSRSRSASARATSSAAASGSQRRALASRCI